MSRRKISLLLAAAAAYGIYKYSKLTTAEKNELMDKGKELLSKGMSGVTDAFNKAKTAATS